MNHNPPKNKIGPIVHAAKHFNRPFISQAGVDPTETPIITPLDSIGQPIHALITQAARRARVDSSRRDKHLAVYVAMMSLRESRRRRFYAERGFGPRAFDGGGVE